jgi:uncharacterized SAM-dependent methyltransferase
MMRAGSELFEAICDLPEYYPTRTELATMQADVVGKLARRAWGPDCLLIEIWRGFRPHMERAC